MELAITEAICETVIVVVTIAAGVSVFDTVLYFVSFLISERDRKSDD